jgi:TolB protein
MFKVFFIILCLAFCPVTVRAKEVNLTEKIESLLSEDGDEEVKKIDVKIFSPCLVINDNPAPSTLDDLMDSFSEDEIDDEIHIGETANSVDEMFVKKVVTENKTRYISLNSEEYALFDKEKANYKKMSKAMKITFDRVVDNFIYLKFYNFDYSEEFCDGVTYFIKDDNNLDIRDYVMSEAFKNTKNVLSSEVEIVDKHVLKLKLFLWDADNSQIIDSKYFIFDTKNDTESILADRISDFIFTNIDKEKVGIFDSKILYVSETGSPKKRLKQIVVSNLKGDERVIVARGKNTKLTPVFSRSNREEIFYSENLKDGFFVIKHNLLSGKKQIITRDDLIMTSSPVFHPKDNKILVSGSDDNGDTNLYLFDLEKNTNRRLTNSKAISTAASFSPDGTKIVYVSDKSGVKKLYIRDIVENTEYLLTKEHGNYDKPVWSPDGKTIAFIKIEMDDFSLGLIDSDGENERYLIKNFLIEGLRWVNNPRFLVYTKQIEVFGKMSIPKIYLLDLKTSIEKELSLPLSEGASDVDILLN